MSLADPTRPGLDRRGPGVFQLCLIAAVIGGLGLGLLTWTGELLRTPPAETHAP